MRSIHRHPQRVLHHHNKVMALRLPQSPNSTDIATNHRFGHWRLHWLGRIALRAYKRCNSQIQHILRCRPSSFCRNSCSEQYHKHSHPLARHSDSRYPSFRCDSQSGFGRVGIGTYHPFDWSHLGTPNIGSGKREYCPQSDNK